MSSEPDFAPLDPRGAVLGDEVYSVLGQAILDGRLRPGERLRDTELAGRLGVSRTPVREALQRLERNGLVEVAAGRWTRVSEPDSKALADTHEFVAYVMANAMRMALPRCSEEELAGILERADALIAASEADEPMKILYCTALMFQSLIRATGNSVFITVLREADLALRRNLTGWRPLNNDPADRTDRYVRMRAALAARDGQTAEAILRAQHGID